LQLTVINCNCN